MRHRIGGARVSIRVARFGSGSRLVSSAAGFVVGLSTMRMIGCRSGRVVWRERFDTQGKRPRVSQDDTPMRAESRANSPADDLPGSESGIPDIYFPPCFPAYPHNSALSGP